jgi:hypothetical protein
MGVQREGMPREGALRSGWESADSLGEKRRKRATAAREVRAARRDQMDQKRTGSSRRRAAQRATVRVAKPGGSGSLREMGEVASTRRRAAARWSHGEGGRGAFMI